MSKAKRELRKDTYQNWIANIISKGTFVDSHEVTRSDTIAPQFAYIETNSYFVKYFTVASFPDYIEPDWLDTLRERCLQVGVKINYIEIGDPHTIDWSSADMKNKINAWKTFTADMENGVDVWNYRQSKAENAQKKKLIESTFYFNEVELEHQRTMAQVQYIIQLICDKDDEGIVNGNTAVKLLEKNAKIMGIKLKALKMNMPDWMRHISQFCRRHGKEVNDKIPKQLLTDDIIASFSGYKQGRIGNDGIPIGMDVLRLEAVLYKFKSDPNKVENWLISAMTGGGKSYFVKSLLFWLLGAGFTETILDYEGDEYTELLKLMQAADPNSAVLVSMGKGSAQYVEPLAIPDLVGDPDIDDDLKDTAKEYAVAMFRIIVHGVNGQLTRWEEGVISQAIANVYAEHRVTDDKKTWCRSKGITMHDVYEEIGRLVDTKEFFDDLTDNVKHKAAVEVLEACRPFFDEEGAHSGTFKQPLTVDKLQQAQLILFSFGQKGAVASSTDQNILALKQLSVANISTQISNYCKYVKHGFNVKIFDEFQRYIEVPGTAEIISNTMTGGRKRGDINFVITNDLQDILDDGTSVMKKVRQSVSTSVIGKIKDSEVVHDFCKKFKCREVEEELLNLTSVNMGANSIYKHAFCVMLDDGKKALVKADLPSVMANSPLFSTGVKVKQTTN